VNLALHPLPPRVLGDGQPLRPTCARLGEHERAASNYRVPIGPTLIRRLTVEGTAQARLRFSGDCKGPALRNRREAGVAMSPAPAGPARASTAVRPRAASGAGPAVQARKQRDLTTQALA
jgi:hypothetical protein